MGIWYGNLINEDGCIRTDQTTGKQFDGGEDQQLQKMQAIAGFLQHDIRYVEIQLGIGGWQPHAAPDVFLAPLRRL